jgi:putative nucleotidyltransferase with HDIG domain
VKVGPRTTSGAAAEERLRELIEGRLAGRTFELPLLPSSAARVLQTCSQESCDARELAALVQNDFSLAANVLRIANSAAYAPREPIVSLQQAIGRLGLSTLCSIAITAAMKTDIFQVPGWESWLLRLWKHSACTAAWAKEIARMRRKNVEGAFLCGLLHDVGRALLLREACLLARDECLSFATAALESMTDDLHARAGAALLAAWSMSPWLVTAVRDHHASAVSGGTSEQTHTVALADRLAHGIGDGELSPEARRELLSHPALQALGIYADEFEALLERRDEVQKLAEAFA